ncbi:MAG: hypothetical protein PHW53_03645 [Patescibacteria group bacterium]|nr:hypothetical protein [Patescibacteria group bacterium]
MKISQYVKEYTDGGKITFRNILSEIKELAIEMVKFSRAGMAEEYEDVFHFLQLWLYCRFGIDGEIWQITKHSVDKFMKRKLVWNRIYTFVGLEENISGFVGNYKKIEKVVIHLQKFGIDRIEAERAYGQIVLEKHKLI